MREWVKNRGVERFGKAGRERENEVRGREGEHWGCRAVCFCVLCKREREDVCVRACVCVCVRVCVFENEREDNGQRFN